MKQGTRVRPKNPLKWTDFEPSKKMGIIKEMKGEEAEVEFKFPNLVNECASCGSMFDLSQSGNSGEIVCMRSGCGHEHGFFTETRTIKLSELDDIDEQEEQEKKKKEAFKKELVTLLKDGINNNAITPKTKSAIEALLC